MAAEVTRFASRRANRWFVRLFGVFLRPREIDRSVAASTWVALSTAVAFTVFDYTVAFAAVCFLAFGDSAAGLVGQKWGQSRVWNKTIEGTAAFVLVSLLVSLVLASVTKTELAPLVIGGLVAAAIEMLPLRLNDNLTIPLASGAAMTLVRAIFYT